MKRNQLRPSANDGQEALHDHLIEKALLARSLHGPAIDARAIHRIVADPKLVRFPTEIVFDAEPLRSGEFAWPEPIEDKGGVRFRLAVHPCFADRPEILPYLVAYHLPTINYGELATREEAELFGATLLGLEVDAYYERLCALADSMP